MRAFVSNQRFGNQSHLFHARTGLVFTTKTCTSPPTRARHEFEYRLRFHFYSKMSKTSINVTIFFSNTPTILQMFYYSFSTWCPLRLMHIYHWWTFLELFRKKMFYLIWRTSLSTQMLFCFGNSQYSLGAKSGEYGGCFTSSKSALAIVAFADVWQLENYGRVGDSRVLTNFIKY